MNDLFKHLNLRPDNPLTLEVLTERLRDREMHFLPDRTIELNEVRVDPNLNMVIPGEGRTFALNSHSKAQLNSLLGFRYDRWFEKCPDNVKQQELNTRLARAGVVVRFRLTDFVKEGSVANGTVAGIVTPGFQPINDALVAGFLGFSLDRNARILRADITEQTSEYVIGLGDPVSQINVGDMFQAISIANSNTGAASFTMKALFVRVACRNGLVVPAFNATGKSASLLISRKHTGSAQEEVLDKLRDGVIEAHGRFEEGRERLSKAGNEIITDPLGALQTVVRAAHQPKKLAQQLLEVAFAKEPIQSKLGIVRAATDHDTHVSLGLSEEARRDLEQAASNYLSLPC